MNTRDEKLKAGDQVFVAGLPCRLTIAQVNGDIAHCWQKPGKKMVWHDIPLEVLSKVRTGRSGEGKGLGISVRPLPQYADTYKIKQGTVVGEVDGEIRILYRRGNKGKVLYEKQAPAEHFESAPAGIVGLSQGRRGGGGPSHRFATVRRR